MSAAPAVAAALRARPSWLLISHARPDGDAVGSSLALAFALEALGARVRVVSHDAAPAPYALFPGVDRIAVAPRVALAADEAVAVLECSRLDRAEIEGLDGAYVVNIDHHAGNTMYGAVNWFDPSAAACAEMVADVIDALGVAWTPSIATHLYLGIVTDTGGFHHANITARTFAACRRAVEAGVDPAAMARQVFDSFSIGRLRLTGVLLEAMELHCEDRLAVLMFDDALLARCGATVDDTESLVNLPLGAKDVRAVALFKRQDANRYRLSLRSKGRVDVRAVAAAWDGGGHTNAAGCTVTGAYDEVKAQVIARVAAAIAAADA